MCSIHKNLLALPYKLAYEWRYYFWPPLYTAGDERAELAMKKALVDVNRKIALKLKKTNSSQEKVVQSYPESDVSTARTSVMVEWVCTEAVRDVQLPVVEEMTVHMSQELTKWLSINQVAIFLKDSFKFWRHIVYCV